LALPVPSEVFGLRGKESGKIFGADRGLDTGKTDSEARDATENSGLKDC
jgi:hypothetical protein